MSSQASQTSRLKVLDVPLRTSPISREAQQAILKELWMGSEHQASMRVYFESYLKRIEHFLSDTHDGFKARSHLDIVSIAKTILSGDSREVIFQRAITSPTPLPSYTAEDTNSGINMCASLLLMTDVKLGISPLVDNISERGFVPWNRGTIQDAVTIYFSHPTMLQSNQQKLDRLFTARNLSRIAGIKIEWTTNLADHLHLHDDGQTVAIFHCVSFLEFQSSLSNRILPADLIEETLITIRLLFPSSDKETESWLRSFPTIDSELKLCGSLAARDRRLEKFNYWHDRLVILKQAFDESSPKTISQWWFDRRNSVQWYTFWVAILVFAMTGIFGLVQIAESAAQIYLARYPSQSG